MSTEKRGAILRTLFKHGDPKSPLYRVLYHPGRKGKRKAKVPVAPRSGTGERAPLAPGVRTQTDAAKKKSKTDYIPSDSIERWDAKQQASMVKDFKAITPDHRGARKPEDVVDVFADNIRHLLEQMTPEDREKAERSAMWYVAGSQLSEDLGSTVTKRHPAAIGAAVLAVLSPKNEWGNNVSQAAVLFEMWNSDEPVGKDVLDRATEIAIEELDAQIAKDKKRLNKALKELEVWKKTGFSSSGKTKKSPKMISDRETELTELAEKIEFDSQSHDLVRELIGSGGPLKGYDESVQQYVYRAAMDVGDMDNVDLIPNKDGSYSVGAATDTVSSPMPAQTEKALRILRAASGPPMSDEELRSLIDVELGSGSKVRSFYINLYDPFDDAQKAVTIDTHMGAALNLLPLAAESGVINKGLFSTTASRGMGKAYPLYAEATRQVAQELGIPPRALQSIVWDYQLQRYGGGGGANKAAFATKYGLASAMILDRLGPEALREWDNTVVPLWRKQAGLSGTEQKGVLKEIESIAKEYEKRLRGTRGFSKSKIESLIVGSKKTKKEMEDE